MAISATNRLTIHQRAIAEDPEILACRMGGRRMIRIYVEVYPCSAIALHLHNRITRSEWVQLRCAVPREAGERAEVGHTRLFPLALRG